MISKSGYIGVLVTYLLKSISRIIAPREYKSVLGLIDDYYSYYYSDFSSYFSGWNKEEGFFLVFIPILL